MTNIEFLTQAEQGLSVRQKEILGLLLVGALSAWTEKELWRRIVSEQVAMAKHIAPIPEEVSK